MSDSGFGWPSRDRGTMIRQAIRTWRDSLINLTRSKVARDRDRLREQVLRGLGWNLHRIWGTAWYRDVDRNGEEQRLRAAIEEAMTAPASGLLTNAGQHEDLPRQAVQTRAARFDDDPAWAKPCRVARVPRLASWIDPGEPGSHADLAPGVVAVVTTEAPVHISVLHQRLREAWDVGRIGSRIRENLDLAILHAGILREGEFLNLAGTAPLVVRPPVDDCQRKVEHVHDDELKLALISIARDASSITYDELTGYVARLYGWNRRGSDITARLGALVVRLCSSGVLTGSDGNLAGRGGNVDPETWLTYSAQGNALADETLR